MAIFKFGRSKQSNATGQESEYPDVLPDGLSDGKDPVEASNEELNTGDGDSISSAQDGVKKAQATTIVWTRNALLVAYAL